MSCMVVMYVHYLSSQKQWQKQSCDCVIEGGLSQSVAMRSSYRDGSHPNYKGVGYVSHLPPLCVNIWVFPQCKPSFYMPLPPLSSSPLPLTLTVRDLPPNGQLNALISAKTAWRSITYQSWLVNGGSLAFGGIWGPWSQDRCRSFVC